MTFYLCTTAKRKNAKRHIVGKYASVADAVKASENLNHDRYKITICAGDWKYIKHIN